MFGQPGQGANQGANQAGMELPRTFSLNPIYHRGGDNKGWTEEFDEASGCYFWNNADTGESKWAVDEEEEEPGAGKRWFSYCQAEDGSFYYYPEDGGEPEWELPEGAGLRE